MADTIDRDFLRAKYEQSEKEHRLPTDEFFPWDEAPLGETLYKGTFMVRVIGVDEHRTKAKPIHGNVCPHCVCFEENPTYGWWIVRFATIKDGPGGGLLETTEYPAQLTRQPRASWSPSVPSVARGQSPRAQES